MAANSSVLNTYKEVPGCRQKSGSSKGSSGISELDSLGRPEREKGKFTVEKDLSLGQPVPSDLVRATF